MRLLFILVVIILNSCTTSNPGSPLKTTININPNSTTVINEYKDSITVVNLNKEGERIDK